MRYSGQCLRSAEITDHLIAAIRSRRYRFLRANYANGDMVGHTGNLQATIKAMAFLDMELGRLMAAIRGAGGVALITADHGNCDQMYEFSKDGKPIELAGGGYMAKTSHSLAPVPFVLYDPGARVPGRLRGGADMGLGNVAATTARILGFEAPNIWNPSLLTNE